MAMIYIVEDDKALRNELAKLLLLNDYEVQICTEFENAESEICDISPDLVILDLNLPETDGRDICRKLRQSGSDVPVLVLTSECDEFSEVMSLKLGAHDFITKPYRPAVLLARVSSIIDHHGRSANARTSLSYDGVVLDISSSEVSFNGNSALLTRNEQRILSLLMSNPETIISRQEIMCDLWESDAFIDDNTLTVNINRLRKTLASIGVDQDFLQTRRGQGYVVVACN